MTFVSQNYFGFNGGNNCLVRVGITYKRSIAAERGGLITP